MENPFNREKSEKPQGEQQRRDPSPRTDRRAIDVVTDKKTVYSLSQNVRNMEMLAGVYREAWL